MATVPALTCPYCQHKFVGVRVTKHGVIKCGKCGKTMRV